MYKHLVVDLKIKKQFLQISAAAFAVSLIPQISSAFLSSIIRRVTLDMGFSQLIMLVNYVNTLVSYAFAPVLIFAFFYFIGKKSELKLELRQILLALLIGFLASFFVVSIIYSVLFMEMTVSFVLAIMLHFIVTFLVADLFATLAGLSIGRNKQKKFASITEQELS